MKITSPAEGYTGKDQYGDTVLNFKDGVATFDGELPDGVRQYLEGAGYGLDGSRPSPRELPGTPDPRDVGEVNLGSPLRDAAVDPRPGDFLAPINAGEANPHGPTVVSPEIHASGPAGIVPGEVFVEDVEKQEAREVEYAEARLIDQVSAAEANALAVPDVDDRGDLGLSDPGSAEVGRAEAKSEQPDPGASGVSEQPAAPSTEQPTAPAKSDNKAAWVDYAVAQGADRGEAEGMTKVQLVEQYGA